MWSNYEKTFDDGDSESEQLDKMMTQYIENRSPYLLYEILKHCKGTFGLRVWLDTDEWSEVILMIPDRNSGELVSLVKDFDMADSSFDVRLLAVTDIEHGPVFRHIEDLAMVRASERESYDYFSTPVGASGLITYTNEDSVFRMDPATEWVHELAYPTMQPNAIVVILVVAFLILLAGYIFYLHLTV